MAMNFGIIGSGSWATALAKILTDNQHKINWWIRNENIIKHMQQRGHNPHYLSSAYFNVSQLNMSANLASVIKNSDVLIIAVPSAYVVNVLNTLAKNIFAGKKIISAIKGILPEKDILLNQYLEKEFNVPLENYFAVLGPCHAEEVAAEKLSYLTFSGVDHAFTLQLAENFQRDYINTIVNDDIQGVQFAAVLKNIYALGAGIAHGLDYGDNFLSVYIANCADEMASFLKKSGIKHIEVGESIDPVTHIKTPNYAASVYLGDLLVTCYSLHSRNRTFGNMIGKGYSVKSAQLEMNMVAEGYNAAKCIYNINKTILAEMPVAATIYRILWKKLPVAEGFKLIEKELV